MCHATVDDLTIITLTPIAGEGFRFKSWEGDPVHNLQCDIDPQYPNGTILVTISHDGACIAVFEAGSTITPPTSGGS